MIKQNSEKPKNTKSVTDAVFEAFGDAVEAALDAVCGGPQPKPKQNSKAQAKPKQNSKVRPKPEQKGATVSFW